MLKKDVDDETMITRKSAINMMVNLNIVLINYSFLLGCSDHVSTSNDRRQYIRDKDIKRTVMKIIEQLYWESK